MFYHVQWHRHKKLIQAFTTIGHSAANLVPNLDMNALQWFINCLSSFFVSICVYCQVNKYHLLHIVSFGVTIIIIAAMYSTFIGVPTKSKHDMMLTEPSHVNKHCRACTWCTNGKWLPQRANIHNILFNIFNSMLLHVMVTFT